MYPTFPSFRRQPPDAPQHRFITLPFSVLGFPLSQVWASLFASQLAPLRPAESRPFGLPPWSPSAYGPMIHLRLL